MKSKKDLIKYIGARIKFVNLLQFSIICYLRGVYALDIDFANAVSSHFFDGTYMGSESFSDLYFTVIKLLEDRNNSKNIEKMLLRHFLEIHKYNFSGVSYSILNDFDDESLRDNALAILSEIKKENEALRNEK